MKYESETGAGKAIEMTVKYLNDLEKMQIALLILMIALLLRCLILLVLEIH